MQLPFGGRESEGRSRFSSAAPALSSALSSAKAVPPTVFVARDAFVDRAGSVDGYELHFHHGLSPAGTDVDQVAAAPALLAAVIDLGLERLANDHPVMLGVTTEILREIDVLELTDDRVGFVLLARSTAPEALAQVARLAGSGRTLAIADYRPSAETDALLPHASLVKIAATGCTPEELERRCAAARRFGARLVACRIDDADTARRCHEAGFDLFQGRFYSRPAVVSGRTSRAAQRSTLTLLVSLAAAATSVDELERVVSSDLGLTVSTLRAVNSAAVALPNRVTSVRQAIVLLGARAVHSLAALLAMTQLSDSPVEVSRRALIRAAMCETLARRSGATQPDRHFTAGMLSMADVLLDQPLGEIVSELPLADEIADALTEGSGQVGEILTAVVAFEQARCGGMSGSVVDSRAVADAYLDAVVFADGLTARIETRRAA